jgi:uncharacterized membrane protein
MTTTYDRIAGQSVERLAALSDGLFAFAMTILVLDLKTPAAEAVHSEAELRRALWAMGPTVLIYLMSFLTLGIFWVGQQTQLNAVEKSDRHLTWLHLAFLFLVTLLPFSTRLLAEFVHYRTALVGYWLNIVLLGLVLYLSWGWATRSGAVRESFRQADRVAVCRRIWISQTLYAVAASLCVYSTLASITGIVVLQLHYVTGLSQWWARASARMLKSAPVR